MKTQIIAIAAIAKNRTIGAGNDLPWKIPADLKYFKEKTLGRVCVMGRKTFESIGSRPLPNRPTIVISRSADVQPSVHKTPVVWVRDVDAAIQKAKQWIDEMNLPSEIMVCGGAEIYKLFLDFCDVILLTEIDKIVEGDAYFPELDPDQFKETSRIPGRDNGYDFDFVVYTKHNTDLEK